MWRTLKQIKQCAKALYLVGNLEHMCIYLDALTEGGWLTAEEEDKLMTEISTECAGITVGEIEQIRNKF